MTPQTPARSAFASALRRLARRDYAVAELRTALAKEGQPEAEIDEAIQKLRAARYLDDTRFAATFTRTRLRARGHGRALIRQGLRSRGIEKETSERAVAQAIEDGSEQEALDAAAQKYWRAHPRVDAPVRLRRLFVFLLRRGFPAGLVGERLRALWPKQGSVVHELEDAQET
jgi:regulatory protein